MSSTWSRYPASSTYITCPTQDVPARPPARGVCPALRPGALRPRPLLLLRRPLLPRPLPRPVADHGLCQPHPVPRLGNRCPAQQHANIFSVLQIFSAGQYCCPDAQCCNVMPSYDYYYDYNYYTGSSYSEVEYPSTTQHQDILYHYSPYNTHTQHAVNITGHEGEETSDQEQESSDIPDYEESDIPEYGDEDSDDLEYNDHNTTSNVPEMTAEIENTSASASNSEDDAVTDATIAGHEDMENLTTVRIVTMDADGDSGGDVIEALPETFYETITSSEAVKEESRLKNAVFDTEDEATDENISIQNATIIPVDTFEEGSSAAEDTDLYLTEETNEVQIENVQHVENIDKDTEVYFTDDNIQNVFETEANKVEISTEGIIITDEAEEVTIENPSKIEILDIEFSGSGMDVVDNSLEEYFSGSGSGEGDSSTVLSTNSENEEMTSHENESSGFMENSLENIFDIFNNISEEPETEEDVTRIGILQLGDFVSNITNRVQNQHEVKIVSSRRERNSSVQMYCVNILAALSTSFMLMKIL